MPRKNLVSYRDLVKLFNFEHELSLDSLGRLYEEDSNPFALFYRAVLEKGLLEQLPLEVQRFSDSFSSEECIILTGEDEFSHHIAFFSQARTSLQSLQAGIVAKLKQVISPFLVDGPEGNIDWQFLSCRLDIETYRKRREQNL